jgi:hypothetical protein
MKTKVTNKTRINVLATIDELNQYLLGNVTTDAAIEAVKELLASLQNEYDD